MVSLKKGLKTLMLAGGLFASVGALKAQENTQKHKDSVSHVLEMQQRQKNILVGLKQRMVVDKATEVSYVFDNIPTDLETIGVASRNNIFFAEPGKLIIGGGKAISLRLQQLGYDPVEVANGVYEINISGDIASKKEQLINTLGTKQVVYKYASYTAVCPTFNDPEQLTNGRKAWLTDVQWVANGVFNATTHDMDSVQSRKGMHVPSTTSNPNIVVNILDGGFDVNNAEFQNRVIRRWNHTNNSINTTATNHGTSVVDMSSATANNLIGGAGLYDGPIRLFQLSADGITIFTTDGYKALDSLIALCQQYPNQRQITNMSFGSGNDPIFYAKLQQLYNMNGQKQNFFQAATGNAGVNSLNWPAARPECTARGATNGTNTKPIRSGSNTGPEMIDHGYVNDGQNVWAMQANGSFAAVTGTSFSTPLGTGTVANIVAQDTSRTNTQVRVILDEGAKDLGTAGPDQTYGKGWAKTGTSLKNAVVRHMPNSFDAAVTPSYNFIPKYYNGLQTTNEKVYVNGSTTGLIPTINGNNEAVFALNYNTASGFVNGNNTIRYEFNTPDGCITSIYKTFTLSNVTTATVPPIPTIINVDPTECQSNPTQVGKLMNPPVAPATIAVTQDGNPITYNQVDSTFSYPVGTPGTHNLRATYSNTAGSSQKDTAYNVTAAITPAAALATVNNANICTGQTATFTANATNVGTNPTYKWYINNVLQAGTASTFTPPAFATAGTYQVKYEVTPTAGGCYTNSAPVTSGNTVLNVAQSAAPIGDVGPNAVAQCENTAASLTFAFGSNNGVPYTHEQHIINPSGVDNVNGIVVPGTITTPILGPGVWKSYVKSTQGTNTCAPFTVYSDTATITVNAQFIADATITAQGQVCDNAAISGTVTPKAGTPNNTIFKLYKQVGTGTPTVFQTTTYTGTPIAYNTTGQIPQVKIWTEIDLPAGGCYVDANGDTATVNVNAIPNAPTATINQPTCALPTGQITINAVSGSTYSFDNGATYGTNNVSGQLAPGTYQLKIKSASGCESVATPAVVNTAPATPTAPVTTITQPTCTVSTGQITINPTAGYTYSFNNGATYGTNNVSGQLAPGSYQIKVKSATGCESAPVTAVVSASPLPSAPTIAQVGTILNVQSPIVGATYQWQKKNATTGNWENVAGATGTSYTVTVTGEYRTNITNNGCGPVASNAVNAVITSVPNPTVSNGKLKLFPNPLQNGQRLTIDSLPQTTTKVSIVIFDSKGSNMGSMESQVVNRRIQLQLPFMPGGLYMIVIEDKKNNYKKVEKIIVN